MDVVHVGPDCLVLECSIGVYELVLRRRRLSTVCLCRALRGIWSAFKRNCHYECGRWGPSGCDTCQIRRNVTASRVPDGRPGDAGQSVPDFPFRPRPGALRDPDNVLLFFSGPTIRVELSSSITSAPCTPTQSTRRCRLPLARLSPRVHGNMRFTLPVSHFNTSSTSGYYRSSASAAPGMPDVPPQATLKNLTLYVLCFDHL